MIIRTALPDSDGQSFTLRPNGSLRWGAAKWVCSGMVALMAVIAAWFTLHGAWLVLPFAGAEMLLVAVALYLSCRGSQRTEVIHVDYDTLLLQRGRKRPEEEHRFQRAWARILLLRDPSGWYSSRLLLRSHGRSIEIGPWLVEDERLELAEELACLTRTGAIEPVRPLPVAAPRSRPIAT